MSPRLDEKPVLEAIEVVIEHIQALARHPGMSKLDGRAITGTLGPYRFLKLKHAADGRMQATPTGDREDASCCGN